jgi:hypothetical protein
MLYWLLVALVLLLIFGALGIAVSPLFFILLMIALILIAGGGYSRRGL